jgi:hypothetical protein
MKRQGLWLLLAASAAVLGACSTTSAPAPVESAAPAGMRWIYHLDLSKQAHLSYGVPDTDNVGIGLQCRRKAAVVTFFTSADKGPAGAGQVRLQSGKAKGRYAARLERSELTDGWDALGEIPLADPVLAAFEKTGLINQVEDKTYPQNARSALERADIKRFFDFCRG